MHEFIAKVTAKSSSGGVWYYTWEEQVVQSNTSTFTTANPARRGSPTQSPAFELRNLEIKVPAFVTMRTRGYLNGQPVYDFVNPALPGTLEGGQIAFGGGPDLADSESDEIDGDPRFALLRSGGIPYEMQLRADGWGTIKLEGHGSGIYPRLIMGSSDGTYNAPTLPSGAHTDGVIIIGQVSSGPTLNETALIRAGRTSGGSRYVSLGTDPLSSGVLTVVDNKVSIYTGAAGAPTAIHGYDASGYVTWISIGSGLTLLGNTLQASGGTGTVTSVGITAPAAGITVSGSPVTTSGTMTLALADDLAALEALASTGIARRTGTSTWTVGTAVDLTSEVTGNLPVANLNSGTSASGTTFWRGDGTWATPAGSGGTVTSVALSLPSILTVSGSPVTTSGTLTGALATQTANTLFAGPTSGGAATPTFRAMDVADVPNDLITYAKIQNISATARILGRKTAAAGDTEECTLSEILDFIGSAAQGDILYRGASAWTRLGAGTSGQVLTTGGTGADPSWSTPATPTGTVAMYAGSSAPTGWLLCDGSSISSSTYLALHAVISNTWGGSAYTGAGSLNFNVPDMRGRAPIGVGAGSGLTSRSLAASGGTETHTLSEAEMPAHTHGPTSGAAEIWMRNFGGGLDVDLSYTAGNKDGAKSVTGVTGSSSAHANMQPWRAINFIIKT